MTLAICWGDKDDEYLPWSGITLGAFMTFTQKILPDFRHNAVPDGPDVDGTINGYRLEISPSLCQRAADAIQAAGDSADFSDLDAIDRHSCLETWLRALRAGEEYGDGLWWSIS